MIKLANDLIDKADIDALIDWLKMRPRLTKGDLTKQFEKEYAKMMGCSHAVFVNSGSMAVMLMVYSIMNRLKNKKVVVPALSWITDISPVMQFGLEPILCDCNLEDLSVDLNHLEALFKRTNPAALLLVSVLGLVPDMDTIIDLCNKYDVILLEDICESLGSEYEGAKLGNFGVMSACSLYFGHHMSTIEGGMICTNDKELYHRLLMLRSHGWDRDLPKDEQERLQKENGVGDFDKIYTFYTEGFNARSTDLQAFIGLGQLKKLEKNIDQRVINYGYYTFNMARSDNWIPVSKGFTSNLGYPIIHPERKKIVKELEKITEVRPLICGSMWRQPFYLKRYGKFEGYEDTNSFKVDKYGFYVPNHPGLTEEDIKKICKIVCKY